MPIDASIYSQIQQPTLPNPLADAAQAQQLQALQNQNKLAALGFSDRQQAQQDQTTLRNALMGLGANATDDQRISALKGTGLPSGFTQADALQKSLLERQKTGADVASKTADTAGKVFDNYKAQLGSVQSPQEAAQFIVNSYHDPVVGPMLQQHGSLQDGIGRLQQAISQPGGFEQWRANAAIGIQKLAELAKVQNVNLGGQMVTQSVQPATGQVTQLGAAPITQSADSLAQNATSRANNAATVGATMRGQNLTDDRLRESNATTAALGKVPSGYRANPDGSLSFIPGGPADPAAAKKASPTEFQGKSAAFGSRADAANAIINDLDGKYSPAAINAKNSAGGTPLIGGMLEAGANSLLSGTDQKAEQAQRDFVNAILRQESGAAIGASEFDNAKKQYFPQPGDGKDVKAQKAQNRKLAVQGLLNNAGNATIAKPDAPAGVSGGWSVKRVN